MRLVAVTDPKVKSPKGGPSWRIVTAGTNGGYSSFSGWDHMRFASYTLCVTAIEAICAGEINPEVWMREGKMNGRKAWKI